MTPDAHNLMAIANAMTMNVWFDSIARLTALPTRYLSIACLVVLVVVGAFSGGLMSISIAVMAWDPRREWE